MNKTRFSILLTTLILVTVVLTACDLTALQGVGKEVAGSGNVAEENREVSGVSGVNLATELMDCIVREISARRAAA